MEHLSSLNRFDSVAHWLYLLVLFDHRELVSHQIDQDGTIGFTLRETDNEGPAVIKFIQQEKDWRVQIYAFETLIKEWTSNKAKPLINDSWAYCKRINFLYNILIERPLIDVQYIQGTVERNGGAEKLSKSTGVSSKIIDALLNPNTALANVQAITNDRDHIAQLISELVKIKYANRTKHKNTLFETNYIFKEKSKARE